jgi:hypothetical protein
VRFALAACVALATVATACDEPGSGPEPTSIIPGLPTGAPDGVEISAQPRLAPLARQVQRKDGNLRRGRDLRLRLLGRPQIPRARSQPGIHPLSNRVDLIGRHGLDSM